MPLSKNLFASSIFWFFFQGFRNLFSGLRRSLTLPFPTIYCDFSRCLMTRPEHTDLLVLSSFRSSHCVTTKSAFFWGMTPCTFIYFRILKEVFFPYLGQNHENGGRIFPWTRRTCVLIDGAFCTVSKQCYFSVYLVFIYRFLVSDLL